MSTDGRYDSALIAQILCSWIMVVVVLYYHSTTDGSFTELVIQISDLTVTMDTINLLSENRSLSTDF